MSDLLEPLTTLGDGVFVPRQLWLRATHNEVEGADCDPNRRRPVLP